MMMHAIRNILLAATLGLAATSAQARPGNEEKGETIYVKRCLQCHGEDGDGLGPAAERLNPPPRDFTMGQYKFRTTHFDDIVPNDEDLYRMVADGMPGTAMPGWTSLLSQDDIWDVIQYIKVFAGIEEEVPEAQVDFGTQIASSAESIAEGDKLFHAGDRCSECHGNGGKGDAVKKLMGDNKERTWPRNLTKPWTYRASSDPRDIYARTSTGIAGTQMPSFADPISKKKLTSEERWHVANYVASLATTGRPVRADDIVIVASQVEGALPSDPNDEAWIAAELTTFPLVPQIVGKTRFFTPSNDTVTVSALYNETDIAFLLEWDDRTRSIVGDADAAKISDKTLNSDAIQIQLPVTIPEGMEKPYFIKGDNDHPVNLWTWTSGSVDAGNDVSLENAAGLDEITSRIAGDIGLTGTGVWKEGTWKAVLTRPLSTSSDKDLQFEVGRFIPIAFAAWDGSNSEVGTKQTLTTWYWILLKPTAGSGPLLGGLGVFLLLVAALFWWGQRATGRGIEDPRETL